MCPTHPTPARCAPRDSLKNARLATPSDTRCCRPVRNAAQRNRRRSCNRVERNLGPGQCDAGSCQINAAIRRSDSVGLVYAADVAARIWQLTRDFRTSSHVRLLLPRTAAENLRFGLLIVDGANSAVTVKRDRHAVNNALWCRSHSRSVSWYQGWWAAGLCILGARFGPVLF